MARSSAKVGGGDKTVSEPEEDVCVSSLRRFRLLGSVYGSYFSATSALSRLSDLVEEKIYEHQAKECYARGDESGHKVRMPLDELIIEVSRISSVEIRKQASEEGPDSRNHEPPANVKGMTSHPTIVPIGLCKVRL
jgi:hypothetical protein